jgi:hypothetical protein
MFGCGDCFEILPMPQVMTRTAIPVAETLHRAVHRGRADPHT